MGIQARVLGSGATVTATTQGASDVCTVHVGFSIGMHNCSERAMRKCHLAHVTEHMVAQLASSKYPDARANILGLAEEGVTTNAWTDEHRTVYVATGPSTGICKYLHMLMCTLRDQYVHEGIKSELESVHQELSSVLPTDGRQTVCKIRELLYDEDPLLLEHSIEYVKQLLVNTGRAVVKIKRFMNRYYKAQGLNVIIATSAQSIGCVMASAEELVNGCSHPDIPNEQGFGRAMASTEEPVRGNPAIPKEHGYFTPWEDMNLQEYTVHEQSMNESDGQARVAVIHEIREIDRTMRDAGLCVSLAAHAVTGGMHSRLYKKLRDELGMAYAVHCYGNISNSNRHASVLMIETETKEKNVRRVVDEITQAIAKLCSEGVSDDEVTSFCKTRRVHLEEEFANRSTRKLASRITEDAAWHRDIMSLSDHITMLDDLNRESANKLIQYHLCDRWCVVVSKAYVTNLHTGQV